MKKCLIAAVALAASSPLAAQELRIGFVAPMTGIFAQIGKDMANGFEMYLDEHGGRLGGAKVRFIVEDEEGKPPVGVRKAEKLVRQDEVHMFIGGLLASTGYALAPVSSRLKTVYLLSVACARDFAWIGSSEAIDRIERTLELLNWLMVACILGSFLVLALIFVPAETWLAAVTGFAGYDIVNARFDLIPEGVDFILLGALIGYAGGGGVANITLANWARDKGYGMSERTGYIPAAVGGKRVHLAHSGFIFESTPDAMQRWRGWWRIVRADQWGVFFTGALLGIVLPALLYVTFLPRGEDIRGLGIAAALAQSVGQVAGPLLAGVIAFLGAWLLLKTQLDQLEAMTRSITDMLWTGSPRVRTWRGGVLTSGLRGTRGAGRPGGTRRPPGRPGTGSRPRPASRCCSGSSAR